MPRGISKHQLEQFHKFYSRYSTMCVISSCSTCSLLYNRHSPLHAALVCPALAPIPNGANTYAPDVTAPYDVDTVATHTCDPGFLLSGFETRQCLAGGIWSGLIPACLSTYKIRHALQLHFDI